MSVQLVLFALLFLNVYQSSAQNGNKYFISAGYGLAGSFFVRSYEEFAPISRYRVFYKKKFIGITQNAAIGISLKKNWEVKAGMNFQHFTRRIKALDTLNNVIIDIDHDIHHRDYMWFGSITKKIDHKNYLLASGLGLYYLRPKQEEVEVFAPNYFGNIERDFKNSRLEEGGVFIELSYEYKFQPKVNIGLKGQFYYTLTAGYAESVTLLPYVKILF